MSRATNLRNPVENCATIASKGVPQPIVDTFFQYHAAADSGMPEQTCRVVFQDNFVELRSPLTPHIDDMLWIVRSGPQPVSLVRRGAAAMQLFADENGDAPPQSSGSVGDDPPSFESTNNTPAKSSSQRFLSAISEKISSAPPQIRWQDTLALNVATQWVYTLTVAVVKICRVGAQNEMVAVRSVTRRVYGQPTKAMFREKEQRAEDQIDFPNMYFNIDDFDEAFGNIQLCDGYGFAVLLTAGNTANSTATIFRGLLSYQVIMDRVAKRAALVKSTPTADRKEFIPLLGPERRGKAEIACWISDAELQAAPASSSAHSTKSQQPQTAEKEESGGFFSRLVAKAASIAKNSGAGKSGQALTGNETLQCCLTFVSVNLFHVFSVLASREPAVQRQWLYTPQSRVELDQILAAQAEREAKNLPQSSLGGVSTNSPSSSTGSSPTTAAPPQQIRSAPQPQQPAGNSAPSGLLRSLRSKFDKKE
jgi:hypothetical protein